MALDDYYKIYTGRHQLQETGIKNFDANITFDEKEIKQKQISVEQIKKLKAIISFKNSCGMRIKHST